MQIRITEFGANGLSLQPSFTADIRPKFECARSSTQKPVSPVAAIITLVDTGCWKAWIECSFGKSACEVGKS
jgi:hypothetical protein